MNEIQVDRIYGAMISSAFFGLCVGLAVAGIGPTWAAVISIIFFAVVAIRDAKIAIGMFSSD